MWVGVGRPRFARTLNEPLTPARGVLEQQPGPALPLASAAPQNGLDAMPMKYYKLGDTGPEVSEICLGTMTWGSQMTDEAAAHAMCDAYVAAGGNFIDTAEMYPVPPKPEWLGSTERYLGNWLAANPGVRKKVCNPAAGPRPWVSTQGPVIWFHTAISHRGTRGGLGWVGLGQGLAWSPTHGPRRLPCGTRLGGRTRVSGHKAYRTVDRPQTPRWRSRAGDAAVPVCMCPCVSEGGGGGLWHTCLLHCCSALARGSVCLVLQAPAGRLESLTLSPPGEMWAWARNLHVTRTCYPTTPRLPIGTGRRWYVARLGSDPHSLTALGTGGAASRAGSGSHGRGRTLGRWRGTTRGGGGHQWTLCGPKMMWSVCK